jgi:EAL domain-containing protein (putative c-di-GMP-specific phosphodiesterase class I)
VRNALRTSGLDARCLMLEITESLMISDVELAIERLSALRELGVRIAIDDFGTGYSSLNYILQLPIDVLKIDKRFIDSVDGDGRESRLAAAIIGLARELDLRCIAEGVERASQQERLAELGCDYAQGFLLGRPMSADALRELLRATVPTRRRGRLSEDAPRLRSGAPRDPNFLRRSEGRGPRSTTRLSRTTAEEKRPLAAAPR